MKYLFENFLTNKSVYTLNEVYWRNLANKLLPEECIESTNIYNNTYANGKKIYDGNPIFSARLKGNRTLRIIQEEPESDVADINAWVEHDPAEKQELVVSLELSTITRDIVKDLLQRWAKQETTPDSMENYLEEKLSPDSI